MVRSGRKAVELENRARLPAVPPHWPLLGLSFALCPRCPRRRGTLCDA